MTCFLGQSGKYDKDLFVRTQPKTYSYSMSRQVLEQERTETVTNCWFFCSYKSRML